MNLKYEIQCCVKEVYKGKLIKMCNSDNKFEVYRDKCDFLADIVGLILFLQLCGVNWVELLFTQYLVFYSLYLYRLFVLLYMFGFLDILSYYF